MCYENCHQLLYKVFVQFLIANAIGHQVIIIFNLKKLFVCHLTRNVHFFCKLLQSIERWLKQLSKIGPNDRFRRQ